MSQRLSLYSQIAPLIHEFESACASGGEPSIEEFLSRSPSSSVSELLLHQLVKKELEHAVESSLAINYQTYEKFGESVVELAKQHVAGIKQGRFQLAGHTISGELGRGAMGTVYSATRDADGWNVAVKTLQHSDPSLLLRIKKEFRSLQGLPSHPNVIDLFELFVFDNTAAFTMEIVEGCKLTELLEQKNLPEDVFIDLFRQVAQGLSHLHAHGLLHRDLKPDNVLVTSDFRAVILDFGLVSELRGGITEETLDYRLKGSLPFMSLEQISGATLTPASDWYSFGVMPTSLSVRNLPLSGRFYPRGARAKTT